MNAVNLLPEKHRPRKPTGGKSGSSYVLLGLLGVLLVGLLGYVLTLNSINSSKTKITQANADAQRLSDQANSLGPYGDFAQIKAERVTSVKQLASQRFDYERLVRELAHVLPSDVWLTSASATDQATGSTPGAAPTAPGAAAAPVTSTNSPTLSLSGCARDQQEVAVTLVRLRQLQGASDVQLQHSTRPEDAPAGTATPAASDSAGAAGDDGCGDTNGNANYAFQATVTFAPITDTQPQGKVPNRLGGGA